MGDNYQKILERISKVSGTPLEEVERKVEAKRAKLSGLISLEGAAQVVAAELNVNFDNETFKIEELLPGMRKVNIVGKIIRIFPVREFTTKKGDQSKVCNMVLADETSNIKLVLWDTNHIELIEKKQVQEGSVVEIKSASMRDSELHLGSFSEFNPSTENLGEVKTERVVKEKTIKEFNVGEVVSNRSFIVQSFDPRFFFACPECGKKAVSGDSGFVCQEHGNVQAKKKAILNIVLDDGTETTRAVVFHDNIPSLGITDIEDEQKVSSQKEIILGKEMIFSGNVRMNSYFNNPELIVNEVREVNLDELLKELEA